jgi:uncharacterized protein YaaR (DUF327 family)
MKFSTSFCNNIKLTPNKIEKEVNENFIKKSSTKIMKYKDLISEWIGKVSQRSMCISSRCNIDFVWVYNVACLTCTPNKSKLWALSLEF